MRVVNIVDLDGNVRSDDLKRYPGMSSRDAFMLFVMSSPLDESTVQRFELVIDDEVVEQITLNEL